MSTWKRVPLALLSACLLVAAQTVPSRAGNDTGNTVPYRRACWNGALGSVYHHDFIVNDRSAAYLLRGPDFVRRHCAPALAAYMSSAKFW